ncbi:MAG: hypothetical protein AKCLJLPJ_00976 [Fimbriimonadales bacterium]|nr:MAG: hypothetical protein EDM73_04610 [Armatimonadota bacterium]MBV6502920.1 hypothetical protein [Fimbriimonadales bacterium]MCE7899274.1 hypothetical protein [Armatimonadetes bacterium ATM1]MDL1927847.1 hypothetical protein [Fimbriimonadia bacterium ATM]MBC6969388.1 hypothetical protein [Armatimonadota bacterium]
MEIETLHKVYEPTIISLGLTQEEVDRLFEIVLMSPIVDEDLLLKVSRQVRLTGTLRSKS